MLVLTRKEQQTITIDRDGEEIEITILKLKGNRVQIGVKAATEIKILRGELKRVA